MDPNDADGGIWSAIENTLGMARRPEHIWSIRPFRFGAAGPLRPRLERPIFDRRSSDWRKFFPDRFNQIPLVPRFLVEIRINDAICRRCRGFAGVFGRYSFEEPRTLSGPQCAEFLLMLYRPSGPNSPSVLDIWLAKIIP